MPQRLEKFKKVAAARTRQLTLVLEDIRHPHNVSACLRTAEAFGIQDIHVVEGRHRFLPSSVTRGVDRWVDVHRWDCRIKLANHLRESGYLLACAYPRQDALALDAIPVNQALAIVFGNEGEGLSNDWQQVADICFTIPMVGMVESLNISVSCALAMRATLSRMKTDAPESFFLNEADQKNLVERWVGAQQRRSREDQNI